MRKDWEYKKLKDICSFVGDGDWIESKDQSNAGLRLIQTGNIGNGIFHDKAEKAKYISESTFIELSCTEIFHGDCLLSRLPDPIGRSCILPQLNERAITAVDCTILRFTNKIYPTFFVYYTLSTPYAISIISKTTGSTRKRISRKNLEGILIPIPPKPTQLAIVAELDKINELIQLKKQQLKDYDQLAQSIFYEMFGDPVENEKGWEVKKLGEIALEKMSYGSGASAVPYNQKIRYIRITDIDELGCLKKDIVSPNICEDKYLLSDGDILFARSGATVGKTFLFKSTYGSCIYAGYLIRLRPNTQIVIPEYIYHYTKTHYYRSFIESNQRVVAQPNINAQQYSSLKLPLPPLPLQQQFAARIEAIERQKQQVSETIKDLETLLASRMQYWFD